MLHTCWSCKTPLPLKAHDGRSLDVSQCPICGANQPLMDFRRPLVWGLFAVCALGVLYGIYETVLRHLQ